MSIPKNTASCHGTWLTIKETAEVLKPCQVSGGHMATMYPWRTSHDQSPLGCSSAHFGAKLPNEPPRWGNQHRLHLDAWNMSDESVHMAQMSDEDGIVYLCGLYGVSVITHGRLYAHTQNVSEYLSKNLSVHIVK